VDRDPLEDFALRVRGVTKTQALDAAAAEALDRFDADGIPCILLKGAALARLLYSSTQQRGYNDVDLLIAPGHLDAAHRILDELGYTNITAARGVEDVAGAVHAETWVRRSEEIGPLMLDLHSRLPGVKASPQAAWPILVARLDSIEVGGRRAQVLQRDGLALHVAIHASQHGPQDPKPQADLRRALDTWPREVWEGAARLAGELEALPAFAHGLRLLPAGAELAAELGLPATDDLDWQMNNLELRPRGTFHLQALAEARGAGERLRVLRRVIWPPREWFEWDDPSTRKGGVRLLAARLLHILRTPLWAARALIYRRRARRRR
jgi:hypothetical protein